MNMKICTNLKMSFNSKTTNSALETNAKRSTISVKKGGSSSSFGPRQSVVYSTLIGINEDDGSQAWCIVVCCFLVNTVVLGFLKCLGILVLDLQTSLKATPTETSILVSITSALNCIAGPLACYLVMKFTARAVAFTGTVLVSFGLMLSFFATSIDFLHFSIGVLVGFGSGFTFSPGIILIGNYFHKNRGIANGIVVSGSPVGGMILPYTLNFLIKYLDCQGALLILGALMMNAVICTMSYKQNRPPKKTKRIITTSTNDGYFKIKPAKELMHFQTSEGNDEDPVVYSAENDSDDSSGPEFDVDDSGGLTVQRTSKQKMKHRHSDGSVIVYKINEKYGQKRKSSHPEDDENSKEMRRSLIKPPFWTKFSGNADIAKDSKLSGTGQNIEAKQSQTKIHGTKAEEPWFIQPFASLVRRNKGGSIGSGTGSREFLAGVLNSSAKIRPGGSRAGSQLAGGSTKFSSITQSQTGSNFHSGSVDSTSTNRRSTKGRKSNTVPKTSSVASPYILSLDHSCVIMWSDDNLTKNRNFGSGNRPSSTLSGIIKRFGGGDRGSGNDIEFPSDPLNDQDILPPEPKKKCCLRIWAWIKNSPIIKNPTFLTLLFSNASTAIATTNILLLIPALGQHRGLTKAESSTVYLIVSVSDLISRLAGAILYDRKYLSSKTIFAAGLAFAGISSFCIGVAYNFTQICAFGSLFGLSVGLHVGIFGTLLAEVVGIALLPIGFAFCMILNGILQFSFINISGKILSVNKDAYKSLYFFYGVCLMIGASLWSIPFTLKKIRSFKKCSKEIEIPKIIMDDEDATGDAIKVEEEKTKRRSSAKLNAAGISNISLY